VTTTSEWVTTTPSRSRPRDLEYNPADDRDAVGGGVCDTRDDYSVGYPRGGAEDSSGNSGNRVLRILGEIRLGGTIGRTGHDGAVSQVFITVASGSVGVVASGGYTRWSNVPQFE